MDLKKPGLTEALTRLVIRTVPEDVILLTGVREHIPLDDETAHAELVALRAAAARMTLKNLFGEASAEARELGIILEVLLEPRLGGIVQERQRTYAAAVCLSGSDPACNSNEAVFDLPSEVVVNCRGNTLWNVGVLFAHYCHPQSDPLFVAAWGSDEFADTCREVRLALGAGGGPTPRSTLETGAARVIATDANVKAGESRPSPQTGSPAEPLSASRLGEIAELVGRLLVRMDRVYVECRPLYHHLRGRGFFRAVALLLGFIKTPDLELHIAELHELRDRTSDILKTVDESLSALDGASTDPLSAEWLRAENKQIRLGGEMVTAFVDWVDAKRRGDGEEAARRDKLWWQLSSESEANEKRVVAFRKLAQEMGQRPLPASSSSPRWLRRSLGKSATESVGKDLLEEARRVAHEVLTTSESEAALLAKFRRFIPLDDASLRRELIALRLFVAGYVLDARQHDPNDPRPPLMHLVWPFLSSDIGADVVEKRVKKYVAAVCMPANDAFMELPAQLVTEWNANPAWNVGVFFGHCCHTRKDFLVVLGGQQLFLSAWSRIAGVLAPSPPS